MAKNKTPRQKMPQQDPRKRVNNFDEVALGYDEEAAVREASRCLNCKNKPCVVGCPVEIDIPGFIQRIREGDMAGAIELVKDANALPAICGRVCPQEVQCEKVCVLARKGEPVAIGRLERYVADREAAENAPASEVEVAEPTGHRAAVIGSGPSGLTVAAELAKRGHEVTIFEAFHKPGGVLVYGIPEFRLPKAIVEREVEYVKSLGVEIQTNAVIGRTFTLGELLEQGYETVFIGIGAGLPAFLGIPGENALFVYSANEYLTRANLMKAYSPDYDTPLARGRRVAVVGGGNVAMDAARTAVRLGAEEVRLVYRRSRAEMPARVEEVDHAEEEGVIFELLTNPVRIIPDDQQRVRAMECVRMELGEPDDSGRRRPHPIDGSEFTIEVDVVVIAIGNKANPLLPATTDGLEINDWGYIVTDPETGATSLPGVYAGGDIVTGGATVILAMGAGLRAARAMHEEMLARDKEMEGASAGQEERR